jgi:hypothetical protein
MEFILQVRVHGWMVHHSFCYDTGSILHTSELVLSLDMVFKSFCWMRSVVQVVIVGGALPGFLGASCSDRVFCAPVVCVSMSVVLRGAKKLRVHTAFGVSLTTVDVGTGLIDFLDVCELSLEICLFRVFTSW